MASKDNSLLLKLRASTEESLVKDLLSGEKTPSEMRRNYSRLEMIDGLIAKTPSPHRKGWLVPTIVALLSLCAVAIGIAVKPGAPAVQVDLTTSSLSIDFGTTSGEVFGEISLKPDSLKASGYQIGSRDNRLNQPRELVGFNKIHDIRFAPNTSIQVSTKLQNCVLFTITQGALSLQVSQTKYNRNHIHENNKLTESIDFRREGSFSFCLTEPSRLSIDSPKSIILSKTLYEYPSPAIHGPVIKKGIFKAVASGRVTHLSDNDRLVLRDISSARFSLVLSDEQHVQFEGIVSKPLLYGYVGTQLNNGENLSPSLFDIAINSPVFAAIFAAVTGLSGMLLGALQWFQLAKKT